MIGFFVILALLMVLVAAVGTWTRGGFGVPRSRVIRGTGPVVVDRRPRQSLGEEIVEEEWEDAGPRPRSRRVVRRRTF